MSASHVCIITLTTLFLGKSSDRAISFYFVHHAPTRLIDVEVDQQHVLSCVRIDQSAADSELTQKLRDLTLTFRLFNCVDGSCVRAKMAPEVRLRRTAWAGLVVIQ